MGNAFAALVNIKERAVVQCKSYRRVSEQVQSTTPAPHVIKDCPHMSGFGGQDDCGFAAVSHLGVSVSVTLLFQRSGA